MKKIFFLLLFTSLGLQACSQKKGTSKENNPPIMSKNSEVATLAAGCFWCVEAIFQQMEGVLKVESGYSGGEKPNPSYKEVCTGETGHAEVVQITYDPQKVSYKDLLEVFFKTHDPTTLNRQGADEGTQYRSSIFFHSPEQKTIAQDIIFKLNETNVFDSKVVTQLEKYETFYVAEDYHQDYFNQNGGNPYCQAVVRPKVEKFQKVFKDKLKH
ncbi:MAG: peptide-methionine (S)-S-oxide reductase MsrA [Leadbetterella sp.]